MKKIALATVALIAALAIFVSVDCAVALAQDARTVSIRIVWTQGDLNSGQYEGWMLGRKDAEGGFVPLSGTVDGKTFDGIVAYNGDGNTKRSIRIDGVDVTGDTLTVGVGSFKSGGRVSAYSESPDIDVSPASAPADVRINLVILKQVSTIRTTTTLYGAQ